MWQAENPEEHPVADPPADPIHLLERMTVQLESAILVLGEAPPLLALRQTLEEMRQATALPAETLEPRDESARLTALHAMLAQEEAGRRVGKRLEETFGQLIANAIVEMDFAGRLVNSDPEAVRQGLQHLKTEFERARRILQDLLAGLKPPPLLAEMGLGPALSRYALQRGADAGRSIRVHGLQDLTQRLPATAELAVFRIIQEGLSILLLERSPSALELGVKQEPGQYVLYLQDDGRNCTPSVLSDHAVEFRFMQDWARAIGGSVRVWCRPEGGMIISVSVPLPADWPAIPSNRESVP